MHEDQGAAVQGQVRVLVAQGSAGFSNRKVLCARRRETCVAWDLGRSVVGMMGCHAESSHSKWVGLVAGAAAAAAVAHKGQRSTMQL